jgi:hypothetical protein
MVNKSFAHYRPGRVRFSDPIRAHAILARSAPEKQKEVDRMNSIKITMTAQTPSCFGMPIYGSASGISRGTTARWAGVAPVATDVRDRHVTGGQSLAMGTFPGTSAWRPPTC